MSTRTNIVLEYGKSRVYVYRHCDGYPSCAGADLAEKLRDSKQGNGARHATDFIRALLAEHYDPTSYDPKPRPVYEVTTEIHGDIDYLYRVKFSDDWQPGGVAQIGCFDLTFSGGNSERRDNIDASDVALGTLPDFVAFVNREIAEQNQRCAKLRAENPSATWFEDQDPLDPASFADAKAAA